jgi:hypothetical protein
VEGIGNIIEVPHKRGVVLNVVSWQLIPHMLLQRVLYLVDLAICKDASQQCVSEMLECLLIYLSMLGYISIHTINYWCVQ